jgi:hypothetical protein
LGDAHGVFAADRWGFGLIAIQIVPIPIAVAKCIVGWLAVTILAITLSRDREGVAQEREGLIASLFRIALWILVVSALIVLFPSMGVIFQNPPPGIIFPTWFLLGTGLLNLGLSEHPIRVAISLLSILQGFELSYLWVEQSLLVLALLAGMDLSIVVVLSILDSYNQIFERRETVL